MTKRIKILGPDDLPPWTFIRPPTDRMRDHLRYLRGELGFVMCRKFAAFEYVSCPCPVMDDDVEPHMVTLCGRGECDNVLVSCEARHSSAEILTAIIDQLADEDE